MTEADAGIDCYKPLLGLRETERAVQLVKGYFERELSCELNLMRVSAPLLVPADSGINDTLGGLQKPVSFSLSALDGEVVEIVQSLSKWKRLALADYNYKANEGIYTDSSAIRPDEVLDRIHSVYVDQWDWELVIEPSQRSLKFLMEVIRRIYEVLHVTEIHVAQKWPKIKPSLPPDIRFIHADELLTRYPKLSRKEREDRICKEWGAVFVQGIGCTLSDGKPHDDRAPDYDDWSTPTERGPGLNGDLLVWNPVLHEAFELSSMGIRVDAETLRLQLAETNNEDRANLLFHRRLLNNELPDSIGGGVGISRLCMFLLRKAHIGEVHVGLWPESMRQELKELNIPLL